MKLAVQLPSYIAFRQLDILFSEFILVKLYIAGGSCNLCSCTVTVTCPRTFITLLSSARHFLNLSGRTMDTLRVLCSSGSQCPFVEDPMCQERPQCRVKSALTEALQGYFQHDGFRPGQLAASLSSTHMAEMFLCAWQLVPENPCVCFLAHLQSVIQQWVSLLAL